MMMNRVNINGNGGGRYIAYNNDSDDPLYEPRFEQFIRDFYIATNNEIPLPDLARLLHVLNESTILQLLLKDPSHEQAKACLKSMIASKPSLPQEFVTRFLTIANMKVHLVAKSTSFLNQSYNAKIIVNNVKPPTLITNLTVAARQQQLRNERQQRTDVFKPMGSLPPQTVKFQFDESLLQRCINSMVELYQTIEEGNRANGYQIDEYIRKNVRYP